MQTPQTPSQNTVEMWISKIKKPKHSWRPKLPSLRIKLSRRLIFFSLGAFLLVSVGVVIWQFRSHVSPIPAQVQNQVSFKIYYPSKLPKDWTIDQGSFVVSQGVVFYSLNTPKGKVTISTQPRPSEFNYNTFYKKSLRDTTVFTVPVGQAAIGKADGNRLLGSMAGYNSWLLLSPVSNSITKDNMRLILTSLK